MKRRDIDKQDLVNQMYALKWGLHFSWLPYFWMPPFCQVSDAVVFLKTQLDFISKTPTFGKNFHPLLLRSWTRSQYRVLNLRFSLPEFNHHRNNRIGSDCISLPSLVVFRKQKCVRDLVWCSEKAFCMAALVLAMKGNQDKHSFLK